MNQEEAKTIATITGGHVHRENWPGTSEDTDQYLVHIDSGLHIIELHEYGWDITLNGITLFHSSVD